MTRLHARIASGGLRRVLLCSAALGGLAAMPGTALAQDLQDEAPEASRPSG
ncbi:MAG: hypothetical protein KatS3mg120_2663 [Erythrobacter sp.]|nr:MAG: hypothetical protein KatS3mg120_2663 [Erythrobacter sp.]